MNDKGNRGKGKGRRKPHYRDTLRALKGYLRPVEPDPGFSRRLEGLCQSMGAEELFGTEWEAREEGSSRRGIVIGGAICSALPFVGVAAYALRKRLLRRRVVALGV